MKTFQTFFVLAGIALTATTVNGQTLKSNLSPTAAGLQPIQQKIKFLPHPSIPTNLLADSSCFQFNKVPKVLLDGSSALTCSQIYDNGTSVGIGNFSATNSNFAYASGASVSYGNPTPPSFFKLYVEGWTASTAYIALSDQRYKKDLSKIDNPLLKIAKINGYTYNWNKQTQRNKNLDDNRQAGFLAQEIEKVLPEAVVKTADGTYGLNYNAIMPLLTEGIKAQQAQIEVMKAQISQLSLSNTTAGKIKFLPHPSIPTNLLADSSCFVQNLVPKALLDGSSALTCSQIYDNGTSVGIGSAYNLTSSDFSYVFADGTDPWHEGANDPANGSTGNYKLAVDGAVKGLVYFAVSDARYKKNIHPISNALKTILALKGVTYNWNAEKFPNKHFDGSAQIGFIAQEVEKVVPQAVVKDKDGFYAMNYSAIIPVLTEGIKAQQVQIEEQQSQIKALQAQVTEMDELKAAVAAMKKQLDQLSKSAPINTVGKSQFQIIPNPVTQVSIIRYSVEDARASSFIRIYGINGQLVKQIALPGGNISGQVQINKNEFRKGSYVMSLINGNNELQSKTFIVQ